MIAKSEKSTMKKPHFPKIFALERLLNITKFD